MMYGGTWNSRSASSIPPMMTTATATIAATSVPDLMPGPLAKAERLVRLTSRPSPALAFENSGMASPPLKV